MKPGTVLHRWIVGDVAACGARARDGAKGTMVNKLVSCGACNDVTARRRAAAKGRFANVKQDAPRGTVVTQPVTTLRPEAEPHARTTTIGKGK